MIIEPKAKVFSNAHIGTNLNDLAIIHQENKNIAICQRPVDEFQEEIQLFCKQNFKFKLSGKMPLILRTLKANLVHSNLPQSKLFNDFELLFKSFHQLTNGQSYRVLFSTIHNDMCRRFHTDFNQLRLLCTYHGPATLWLPEEGANRHAHYNGEDNEAIVKDESLIQQANTGDVLILKGAAYPNAHAVIHKSPAIQEKGQERLLLRIDINDGIKF